MQKNLKHGGASREDNVAVQILSDIDVAFHDRVVGGLVDTIRFLSNEVGLEQHLGASESLVTNGNDLSIGQLVVLLQGRRFSGFLHLLIEVDGDVGKFLLDVTDN